MRRPLLLALLAAGLLVSPSSSFAARGVALDLGRIDVAQTLTPGGGYRLPPVGVRNPGDESTSYRIVVSELRGLEGKPIPAEWLRFEPTELTLKPGRTRKVAVRLSLPTGADPGDYAGLLAAQIVTEGEGAQVGAAAAAKVTFSVESKTLLGAWWYRLRTFAEERQPWTWLVPAVLGALLLGRQLRSRFAFRVERRA